MYRLLFVSSFIFFLSATLFAQTGVIKGNISDSISKVPVEFANIAFYKMPGDSLIAGTLSDVKGNFIREGLPFGNYKIQISFIGYTPITLTDLTLNKKKSRIVLESIILSPTISALNEINVTDVRKPFEQTFDKKIFTMDEKRSPGAITVLDQLKTLPSITVDPEGNVKYRGQTPTILVDDQPYHLLYPKLEMIPASNVDKVEFIEPSARYASSVGTINIKLKRPKENGFSGAAYASVGTIDFKSVKQTWGGFNVNYKYKKLILFGNVNLGKYQNDYEYSEYMDLKYDSISFISESRSHNHGSSNYQSESAGAIFAFSEKSKLTFTWSPSSNSNKQEALSSFSENIEGIVREAYNSVYNADYTDRSNSFSLAYNKKFKNEQEEFTLKSSYSKQKTDYSSHTDRTYSYYSSSLNDSLREQIYGTKDNNNVFSMESYYVLPIDSTGRWELGTQSEMEQPSQNILLTINNVPMPDYTEKQKDFIMDHALYTNLGKKWGKFKFDGGLRLVLETINSDIYIDHDGTDSIININKTYPYLVPNANIGFEIKPFHELKVSYSLDQEIPEKWQLNPYIDKSDPRSWSSGNSELKPYMFHRFTFGYMYAPEKYSISLDAFTYFSNNYSENISIPINNYTMYSKPENIGKSTGTGITVSGSVMPVQWFNAYFSADFYKAGINASSLQNTNTAVENNGLKTNTWTASGNLNTSLTIKKKNTFSVYLNYSGRNASIGGYTEGSLYNGVYYSRRFFNSKLNLFIGVQNLVDKNSRWKTTQEYFGRKSVSEYRGTWNQRTFRISLRYYFNQGDRGLLDNQQGGGGGGAGGPGGKGK